MNARCLSPEELDALVEGKLPTSEETPHDTAFGPLPDVPTTAWRNMLAAGSWVSEQRLAPARDEPEARTGPFGSHASPRIVPRGYQSPSHPMKMGRLPNSPIWPNQWNPIPWGALAITRS